MELITENGTLEAIAPADERKLERLLLFNDEVRSLPQARRTGLEGRSLLSYFQKSDLLEKPGFLALLFSPPIP
jgi:hypothetical protein